MRNADLLLSEGPRPRRRSLVSPRPVGRPRCVTTGRDCPSVRGPIGIVDSCRLPCSGPRSREGSGEAPRFFTWTASASWGARSLVTPVRRALQRLHVRSFHLEPHTSRDASGTLFRPNTKASELHLDGFWCPAGSAYRRCPGLGDVEVGLTCLVGQSSLSKKSRIQDYKWFWLLTPDRPTVESRSTRSMRQDRASFDPESTPREGRRSPRCSNLRNTTTTSSTLPVIVPSARFDRARETPPGKTGSLCTRPCPLEGSSCLAHRPIVRRRLRDAGSRSAFVTFSHLPRQESRSRAPSELSTARDAPMRLPSLRRAGFRRRVDPSPCLRFEPEKSLHDPRLSSRARRGLLSRPRCGVHELATHPTRPERSRILGEIHARTVLSRATDVTREPRPTFPEGSDDSWPMRAPVRATFLETTTSSRAPMCRSRMTPFVGANGAEHRVFESRADLPRPIDR